MKVLMFGWEFPPHISGGLGTACFGLTESLLETKTKILFVIPRAESETVDDSFEIINASEVTVPSFAEEIKKSVQLRQATKPSRSKSASKLVTITVSSALSPYLWPAVLSSDLSLLQWNYEFDQAPLTVSPQKGRAQETKELGVRYQFSGTYGPRLMDEVKRFASTATEIAKARTFDVIHAHDWLTYLAGMAAKKISGKPLVVHVHATEVDRAGKNGDPRVFDIERKGMEAADRVIAVSQWTKNIIIRHYNIPSKKVNVVHNGVMPKSYDKEITPPPIGKHLVTFLGRVTHQKGPEYFIDVAARVLKKLPDVHFVMAGSGDLLPKMIERAAHLRITSHFHFAGFLKGDLVDRLLAATDVYVMPSVSEPFGITPLEAAQAGVPVIISRQSGVSEVMQHAIKVDFWNIEALADAVCNLLKYPGLSKTLKAKSREEITNITWNEAARKINRIYHELTEKNQKAISEPVLSGSSTQAPRSV